MGGEILIKTFLLIQDSSVSLAMQLDNARSVMGISSLRISEYLFSLGKQLIRGNDHLLRNNA